MAQPLPDDPAKLKALLLAERGELAAERQAHAATTEELKFTRLERDQAKAKLQALLKRYFGRSSEKLDENQLKMAWAAVEADLETRTPPKPQKAPSGAEGPSERRARRLEDLPVFVQLFRGAAEVALEKRLQLGLRLVALQPGQLQFVESRRMRLALGQEKGLQFFRLGWKEFGHLVYLFCGYYMAGRWKLFFSKTLTFFDPAPRPAASRSLPAR